MREVGSCSGKDGVDALERRPSGGVRVIDVGIQFNRHPAIVADGANGLKYGREINRSLTRHEMMMHARGGDVFQMHVTYVLCKAMNRGTRLVADTVHMPYVEIQADGGR